MMRITKPTKAIISALGTVLIVLTGAVGDDVLSMSDLTQLITTVVEAAATVYAVWRVPNRPVADSPAVASSAK